MAIFTIQFQRGQLPGPTYEDFSVTNQTPCNQIPTQKVIKFNDLIGDFVVGYNYQSSTSSPANQIRFESFTDETVSIEISTNIETIITGLPQDRLKDSSTGLDLTYPYIIPIANLPNIILNMIAEENLVCPSDPVNYTTKRRRKIEYIIFDTNGIPGPVKIAEFDLVLQ